MFLGEKHTYKYLCAGCGWDGGMGWIQRTDQGTAILRPRFLLGYPRRAPQYTAVLDICKQPNLMWPRGMQYSDAMSSTLHCNPVQFSIVCHVKSNASQCHAMPCILKFVPPSSRRRSEGTFGLTLNFWVFRVYAQRGQRAWLRPWFGMHLGKLVQVHICGLIAAIDVVVKSLWSDSKLIEVKYHIISFALPRFFTPCG